MERQQIKRWLVVICGLAGVILLVVTGFLYADTREFIDRTVVTEAIVVGMTSEGKSFKSFDDSYMNPYFVFTTADDEIIQIEPSSGVNISDYSEGDIVSVRYDPDNPHDAKLDSFRELWLTVTITGTLALLFVLAGLMIFWSLLRDKRTGAGVDRLDIDEWSGSR